MTSELDLVNENSSFLSQTCGCLSGLAGDDSGKGGTEFINSHDKVHKGKNYPTVVLLSYPVRIGLLALSL